MAGVAISTDTCLLLIDLRNSFASWIHPGSDTRDLVSPPNIDQVCKHDTSSQYPIISAVYTLLHVTRFGLIQTYLPGIGHPRGESTKLYYRPQWSCEGCFYRCLSVHGGGGGLEYLGRYTPLPRDLAHPPGTRYTPRTRYTPLGPGTPPETRYTPRDQVHPPGTRYTGDGWRCGRYASYWNAFLFVALFSGLTGAQHRFPTNETWCGTKVTTFFNFELNELHWNEGLLKYTRPHTSLLVHIIYIIYKTFMINLTMYLLSVTEYTVKSEILKDLKQFFGKQSYQTKQG